MSNSGISKKKERPLNDTFFNLCKDLLRFIERKIIKKYISPNVAQLPKEKRSIENKTDTQNKVWTYFYKEKEITKEEIIKDVFKDDHFLGHLQNLTKSLIIVIDYLDQNQINIKNLEEAVKNKEEKINSLNELKNLLNNYFEKSNDVDVNNEHNNNNNILEDKNLMNIMNKIKLLNSNNFIDAKITENIINLNDIDNKNNDNNDNINNNNNNFVNPNNNIINDIEKITHKNKSKTPQKEKKISINIKKDIDIDENNPKNDNSKDIKNSSNQCLSAPCISRIANIYSEGIKKEDNINEKKELDFLIDNLKINNNIKKEEKNESESEHFFDLDVNQEISKYNIFLTKKLEREREKEKDIKNDVFDDKINNDKNYDNSICEKKKGKNKKKKLKIKHPKDPEKSDNNNDNNDIDKNIQLKEETFNSQVVETNSEKNKDINKINNNNKEVDEDILKLLLDDIENNKNEKKENDNKLNNILLEFLISSELEKQFSEINIENERIKIITDIISLIKTKNIKNFNPKINGPYLVGSYKTIPNLTSINYLTSIDIMYTYKDIVIDKQIIDFTVNDIIKNILNLNIIETSNTFVNKIAKIIVKCCNDTNITLDFNIYFMDVGIEYNKKIINDIILNEEKINFENKEEEKKFTNIILFLRIWRKKYKLLFIIPEILDEIAKKYFDPNKTIALVIFNVFYDLYNCICDLNSKKNQGIPIKYKLFIENLIKAWFDDEKNCEEIKQAVLETNIMLTNKSFKALFNNSENE